MKTKSLRKEFINSQRGITLIALIVTIIILLILVGVILSVVMGNNGLLNRAEKATSISQEAIIKEEVEILIAEKSVDYCEMEDREPTLGEYLVKNSPEEGYEGRGDTRIFFESIENEIAYITYEDKKGNKTFLTMDLDGANLQIIGSSGKGEIVDKVAPTLHIISSTTQSITFTSTDRVGVLAYQITEENSEPSDWKDVESTKKLEKTILELENNKTYYIWVKDEAGNVSSRETATIDFEEFSYEVSWNEGTATIQVTNPKSGVQFKIESSGTWTDYSETTKPSAPNGTEVFFQATDGKNKKQYASVVLFKPLTITYNANSGTGDVPESQTAVPGEIVELKFSPKPEKEGSEFVGWIDNYSSERYFENELNKFTMPERDVQFNAAWKTTITAEDIANNPKQYLGQRVSTKQGNTLGTRSFTIFYADSENIYLISSDLRYNQLPKGKKGSALKSSSSDSYTANLSTVLDDYPNGTGDISSDNPAKKWMKMYTKSGANLNQKALAYMLDTNQWNAVFAEDKINMYQGDGIKGADVYKYVIGGPTVELYQASWNARHPEKKIDLKVDSYGYRYKFSSSSSLTTSLTLPTYLYGYSNRNYILASPSNVSVSAMVCAKNGGTSNTLANCSTSTQTYYTPLLCLENNVVLEKIIPYDYEIKIKEQE